MNTIWKCSFCNETQFKRSKILKHEAKCANNPDNRLCFTCQNLIRGSKKCGENILMFNVFTSGINCQKWIDQVGEKYKENNILFKNPGL